MLLGLSSISNLGLWVLVDEKSHTIVHSRIWGHPDSSGLFSRISDELELLLKESKTKIEDIEKIFCVIGPGAFTGLRMGAAFCQGLSQSLKIPLFGIPSFDLYQKTFFLPLRQQLCQKMSLEEALQNKLEFLKIAGPTDFEIASPQTQDFVVGMGTEKNWPEPQDLLLAIIKNKDHKNQSFELIYGSEAKVSGQATSHKLN